MNEYTVYTCVTSSDTIIIKMHVGSMEGSGEILNMRDQVAIRNSHTIEGVVVTAWSAISRGPLWNHVEWQ